MVFLKFLKLYFFRNTLFWLAKNIEIFKKSVFSYIDWLKMEKLFIFFFIFIFFFNFIIIIIIIIFGGKGINENLKILNFDSLLLNFN